VRAARICARARVNREKAHRVTQRQQFPDVPYLDTSNRLQSGARMNLRLRQNSRTPGEVTARNLSDLALASMAMA